MSNENNKRKVGRPSGFTDEVIRKIEEVAALDGSIEEMAFYAGVHRATLYRWLQEDEEFSDRIKDLRQKPVLKARQAVVKSLDDPNHAFKYLEKKKGDEFGNKTTIKHEGAIENKHNEEETEAIVQRVTNEYEEKLKIALSTPANTQQKNSEVELKHEEKEINNSTTNTQGTKQGNVANNERTTQPGGTK